MERIGIYDARARLSELIERVHDAMVSYGAEAGAKAALESLAALLRRA